MSNSEAARAVFFEALDHLDAHRYVEAERKFRDASALLPNNKSILTNLALALFAQDKFAEARDTAAQAVQLDERNVEAHLVIANCLGKEKKYAETLGIYDTVIAIDPNLAEVHTNRGFALNELGRFDEALASYDRAIALEPDSVEAHWNGASTLAKLKRYDEAIVRYDKVIALKPGFAYAQGSRLHAKMHSCDWREFEADCTALLASLRSTQMAVVPFVIMPIASTPSDQYVSAKRYAADKWPASARALAHAAPYSHNRIRVAYLSADLHDHATAYLMAGMFEHHDRSRFETTAMSFGPDQGGDMRRRLNAAFERFIDVRTRGDDDIAALIRSLEIDIAVDLKGPTEGARPNVLAQRPAPIQVSYIGYPGTTGTSYIDYLLADRIIVPEQDRAFYTEQVVHLPNSYQVNDAQRRIAERPPNRRDENLPEQAFVFCSFNNNYKITPEIFDVWMRLLRAVDGSVLWLFEGNATVARNLRREAVQRGVAPERLIFARHISQPEHLARHRLADLFLDTRFCNAHTTGSDALWAGLPMITCLGTAFAGRVAASLLHAVGLPELVTNSMAEYEALALELARAPALLASCKARLTKNRTTCALFDTARTTRHVESAYLTMVERHRRGLPPAGFAVEPIA